MYGLAVRVTAPLRLTEAVRARGREQLASLSIAAMMSRRVAVMITKSIGRVGEVRGRRSDVVQLGVVGVLWGHYSGLTQRLLLQCRSFCP